MRKRIDGLFKRIAVIDDHRCGDVISHVISTWKPVSKRSIARIVNRTMPCTAFLFRCLRTTGHFKATILACLSSCSYLSQMIKRSRSTSSSEVEASVKPKQRLPDILQLAHKKVKTDHSLKIPSPETISEWADWPAPRDAMALARLFIQDMCVY
jgi:hypothetical protein